MSQFSDEFGYHDLERAALAFVLESETWPVFLAWAVENATTDAVRAWLKVVDIKEARDLGVAHSHDPLMRLLGGLLP